MHVCKTSCIDETNKKNEQTVAVWLQTYWWWQSNCLCLSDGVHHHNWWYQLNDTEQERHKYQQLKRQNRNQCTFFSLFRKMRQSLNEKSCTNIALNAPVHVIHDCNSCNKQVLVVFLLVFNSFFHRLEECILIRDRLFYALDNISALIYRLNDFNSQRFSQKHSFFVFLKII